MRGGVVRARGGRMTPLAIVKWRGSSSRRRGKRQNGHEHIWVPGFSRMLLCGQPRREWAMSREGARRSQPRLPSQTASTTGRTVWKSLQPWQAQPPGPATALSAGRAFSLAMEAAGDIGHAQRSSFGAAYRASVFIDIGKARAQADDWRGAREAFSRALFDAAQLTEDDGRRVSLFRDVALALISARDGGMPATKIGNRDLATRDEV